MRIELKGTRAIVHFDKGDDVLRHQQDLVRWCNSNGLHPVPRVSSVNVGFSSAEDAESDFEALKNWCKSRVSDAIKQAVVGKASEYKPTQVAKPIFETEQRTPLEMWNLWYKILHTKFPAIMQPKKIFKRELGMLRIMLDAYDHLIVEKIFQTAVDGWTTMTMKHRGLSDVPTLELVMKFRSELQSASSGSGMTSNTQRVPQGPGADKAYDDYKT